MLNSMTDRTTPNLPSRDFAATAQFYERLGFSVDYQSDQWMILARGPLVLEFFPHPDLDPYSSWFSCCVRVRDLDALYTAFAAAGLPGEGIPRLMLPVLRPWGLREFALIDADGSLLRCIAPADVTTDASDSSER